MRVSTVNLSPAVDRTYYTDGFCINGVNRARLVKVNAGGKGINFAAVLGLCGAECEAMKKTARIPILMKMPPALPGMNLQGFMKPWKNPRKKTMFYMSEVHCRTA